MRNKNQGSQKFDDDQKELARDTVAATTTSLDPMTFHPHRGIGGGTPGGGRPGEGYDNRGADPKLPR